jgi:hypothetical protein
MAAVTIDSPRWKDGWGEPLSQPHPKPALRLVDGAGTRRPDLAVYRRRRRAVLVVAALLVVAVLAVGSALVRRVGEAGAQPVGRQVHVVEAGETYWSIAAAHHDGGDLRVEVDALVDANGGRLLLPGDRIELP